MRALVDFVLQTHPRKAEAALAADWRGAGEALAASADALSHSRYVVEVMRLLSWFKDGHTRVRAFAYPAGPFVLDLPIRVSAHFDGVFVDWAGPGLEALLNARLTHVADQPVERVISAFAEVWPADNPAWAHRWAPEVFHSPGLLHGLGFVSGADDVAVPVRGVSIDGAPVSALLQPRAGLLERRGAMVGYNEVKEPPPSPRLDHLESGRALLARIDAMADVPDKTFGAFTAEFHEALSTTSTDRVILDLRRNGGGDNFLGEPIRHRLQQSRFNRTGGLYILIGPRTFSAAQCLVSRLERESYALLVGEPTGCSPNHYGDARPFVGDATGLRASVSTLRWQDMPPFDRRLWSAPDIAAPDVRADVLAGRDRALQAALDDRSTGAWDDDRLAGPWARASQTAEWKPFWMNAASHQT